MAVYLTLTNEMLLVRSRTTSVVKDLYVDHGQWDELAKALTRSIRMEVTSISQQAFEEELFLLSW
jgi:hypothetical protein